MSWEALRYRCTWRCPTATMLFNRATAAGAEVTMAPMDAFWGARFAQVVDPFGHAWSFAHPLQGVQG